MLLLPVAPWLLCIWQAREVGATWWSVLITIFCVQLSRMLFEQIASDGDYREENSGWPELLRASVGITVSVYVVHHVILDFTTSSCLINIGIMLLVLACIMNYDFPFAWRTHVIISIAAIIAVTLREWGPFLNPTPHKEFNFSSWLQFLLSVHAMMVGHTVGGSEHPVIFISPYVRIACTLSVSFFACMQYHKTIFTLMVLPSIFFREKNAVTVCIIPIINSLFHSDLYPLQDTHKYEARRILLIQQKQEILFYIMAWCVVLGLWAHIRPSVLFWVQVLGGILYLASLRRYSNVVRILSHHRPHSVVKRKEEHDIPKRNIHVDATPDLLLSRMMMQHSKSINAKTNINMPLNS